MIRFILADLRLHAIGALVVVLLIGSATALGMAVRIEERALRLGSARAADRFDLVVGAAGSQNPARPLVGLPPARASHPPERPGAERSSPRIRASPSPPRYAFGNSFLGYPLVGPTGPNSS